MCLLHATPSLLLPAALLPQQATSTSLQLLCPSSGQRHWLRASLKPDGCRAFTIDGKARTGAQVKVGGGAAGARAAVGGKRLLVAL
jgi:hypothetical protein